MKVASDSAYIVVGSAGQAAIALLLAAATARLLGPSGRGELYYVLQAASLLGLIAAMGVGSAMQRRRAAGLLHARSALRLARRYTVIASLSIAVVGLVVDQFGDAIAIPPSVRENIWPLIALTGANCALLLYGGIFTLREHGFRDTAITALLGAIVTFLVVSALPFLSVSAAVRVALIGYAIPVALRAVWFDSRLAHDVRADQGAPEPGALDLMRESSLLFAGNVVVALIFRVDTFILEHIRGVAEVGTYSLATSLAEMVLWIPSALGSVLFARLPSAAKADREHFTPLVARRTLFLTAILCAAIAFVSEPVVRIMGGDRFSSATLSMRLLLPGVLAMSVNYVLYNYFASTAQVGTAIRCFLAGVLLNIALNSQLIPRFGEYGAAVSSSLAYIATAVLLIERAARSMNQSMSAFFMVRRGDLRELSGVIHGLSRLQRSRG